MATNEEIKIMRVELGRAPQKLDLRRYACNPGSSSAWAGQVAYLELARVKEVNTVVLTYLIKRGAGRQYDKQVNNKRRGK